jgi:hypothetical protein
LVRFLDHTETQHGVRVAICHLDNDTALINKDTRGQLARRGTVFELSTPYTAHQNAVAESSKRMTETRSRNMLIAAPHLPKALWPYAACYAVELLNHYPTTAVPCGKTPRQMLLEHMKVVNPVPSLHSVRTFGEPGYVHTPVQKRIESAKFQPRATKMYFVGREGSRIYHMWDSATGKVHRSSSVTWAKHELVKLPQALGNKLPQASRNELSQTMGNDIPYTQRHSIPLFEPALSLPPNPPYTPTDQDDQESGAGAAQQPGGEEVIEDKTQLPELGSGFEFDGLAEGSSFDFDRSIDNNTDNSLQALADTQALPPRPKLSIHDEAPRHLDISASVESRNILQGKQTRKPSHKLAVAMALHNPRISATLARCFATAIAEAPAATKLELPLEPTSMKQARVHIYSKDWLVAEGKEYKSHDDNNTWDIVLILPVCTYALPTKWVYKYKFDDTGKLICFKARLVVCGNRQNIDFWRETYAAVARSTTLKVLLALVAALNLECDQLDIVTAFLNGWLDKDEDIYIRLPDGRLAKVRKALYGLRRSPRL